MPGSVPSMAVQKSAIPQARGPLSTYTIKTQRKGNSHGRMEGEWLIVTDYKRFNVIKIVIFFLRKVVCRS